MPDLDRFKNPWAAENSRWYGNAYRKWNRPALPDNAPAADGGGGVRIIPGYKMEKIFDAYEKDGQEILEMEYNVESAPYKRRKRWKDLYGENTCAIKLSYALNNAGYFIPEHETINKRVTYSSNLEPIHQYILGADEMGHYLEEKFGTASIASGGKIESDEQLEQFMYKFDRVTRYAGFIYLDSHNASEFEASGHVDLLFQKNGKPYLYGREIYLDTYIDNNNNDSFWPFNWGNSDSQLDLKIWLMIGETR